MSRTVVLAAAISLALAACSGKESTPVTDTQPAPTQQPAPMLIGAVILLGALAFDGTLSPVDGGLLVVAFVLCALAPLALLVLAHDALTCERDRGRFPLLLAQGGSAGPLLAARVTIRAVDKAGLSAGGRTSK